MLEFRLLAHGSAAYDAAVKLRSKVLREPLGLQFDPAQLAKEKSDIHIGAFESGTLIGCLILTPVDGHVIKMRQVAVDPLMQGVGIGRALVEYSEVEASNRGFLEMVLSARESVVPFYESLGYDPIGATFTEVTIPHRKMHKML
ncbi:MAG: GNAT family N-acetyltransferase [Bdellovibrionota bacterium]